MTLEKKPQSYPKGRKPQIAVDPVRSRSRRELVDEHGCAKVGEGRLHEQSPPLPSPDPSSTTSWAREPLAGVPQRSMSSRSVSVLPTCLEN